MKTREELLNQIYLSQTDIQQLLSISYEKAKRLYDQCDYYENGLNFRLFENKIRMKTLLHTLGISYEELERSIKKRLTANDRNNQPHLEKTFKL